MLDSITYEEANNDFVNWIRQRSRWYKGYLLTFLVHLRRPRLLLQQLGVRGTLGVVLFIGGTPLLSLVNPVAWALTLLWFLAEPGWLGALFPTPWYHLALFSLLLGNAAVIYAGVVAVRHTEREDLLGAALSVPAYWVMMAASATKALVQLVQRPTFWEKTQHGLARTSTLPPPG